ncbi:hypothetical protein NQ028_07850, partial [Corynebacterium phoceense]|nr:hypothetical protein [Corynebacterium phoceense]
APPKPGIPNPSRGGNRILEAELATGNNGNQGKCLGTKPGALQVVSRGTQLLLVSPRHEHLLWLPDLIAMAFRRKITHKDETSTYFKEYVEGSTTVLET